MAMAPTKTIRYLVFKRVLVIFIFVSNLPRIDGELEKKMVHAHNDLRKMHSVDRLHLSKDLNERAMQCAQHYHAIGNIDHSCPQTGNLGENLYINWGDHESSDEKILLKAVDGWYAENEDYDFATGKQKATAAKNSVIGNFTQIVWKDSKYLGVALYRKNDAAVVVCLYDPHGNIEGNYRDQVLPEHKTKTEPAAGREHEHTHDTADPNDSDALEQREARARNHRRGHHAEHGNGKPPRMRVSWGFMAYLLLALCVLELLI